MSLTSFLAGPQAGGESSVKSVGVNITNGTGGEGWGEDEEEDTELFRLPFTK